MASGSVGQVHRARLRAEHALDGPGKCVCCSRQVYVAAGTLHAIALAIAPQGGQLRDVAVKVQHPGVIDSAFMDLNIVTLYGLWEFPTKLGFCPR